MTREYAFLCLSSKMINCDIMQFRQSSFYKLLQLQAVGSRFSDELNSLYRLSRPIKLQGRLFHTISVEVYKRVHLKCYRKCSSISNSRQWFCKQIVT